MTDSVDSKPQPAYENRIVAFIDILGFRELVSLSTLHPEATAHIYAFIQEIQTKSLNDGLYGAIPTLGLDGTKELKPARTLEKAGDAIKMMKENWPIEITQFSDSLVLSCKADEGGACVLMIEFIAKLMRVSFELGFILRGGITLGPLIHEEGGPLFGPAFVEAYALESKSAVWPRILIEQAVVELVINAENKLPHSKPFSFLFTKIEKNKDKPVENRDLSQFTLASAILFFEKTYSESVDKTGHLEKLKALAQSYSCDEKVYPKYESLLNDWLEIFGSDAVNKTAGGEDV
jgi:hypothetical protein